jgi:hypothetical protein
MQDFSTRSAVGKQGRSPCLYEHQWCEVGYAWSLYVTGSAWLLLDTDNLRRVYQWLLIRHLFRLNASGVFHGDQISRNRPR